MDTPSNCRLIVMGAAFRLRPLTSQNASAGWNSPRGFVQYISMCYSSPPRPSFGLRMIFTVRRSREEFFDPFMDALEIAAIRWENRDVDSGPVG